MIEIICNDRLGKKVRIKCNPDDTIGDLKKLIAAQTGTKAEKIVLKKWCKFDVFVEFLWEPLIISTEISIHVLRFSFFFLDNIFKDNITLADYGKNMHFFFAINRCFILEIHDGMSIELYYQ